MLILITNYFDNVTSPGVLRSLCTKSGVQGEPCTKSAGVGGRQRLFVAHLLQRIEGFDGFLLN